MKVALVNDERWISPVSPDAYVRRILAEDAELERAFAERGAAASRAAWSDSEVDWAAFDALLIRQTWDYFERLPEFLGWLERVEPIVRIVNPADVIRWNADKRYLVELAGYGLSVVPTEVVVKGDDSLSLAERMDAAGWDEAVIKPAVSGAGRETYRIARTGAEARERLWRARVAAEDMLIQPFEPAILKTGETSLMVIDGTATHAVRKIAAAGEFRVQDDHGGTVHAHEASAEERKLAERAIARAPGRIDYARVDLVDSDDGPRIMELELIEPELFFRVRPEAADRLAGAVLRRASVAA